MKQKAEWVPLFRVDKTIGVLLDTICFTQKEAVFEQLNKEVAARASVGCLRAIKASTTLGLSPQSSHEQKLTGTGMTTPIYPHAINFYITQLEAYNSHLQPDQACLSGCPLCLRIKSSTLIVLYPIATITELCEPVPPVRLP